MERPLSLLRLLTIKLQWERLGRRDPYWAILTDKDKRHGRWEPEQFFRTGADEMRSILDRAERMGLQVPRHRALDFGCGIGRVTQAMPEHFKRCDGVDISASMLRLARHYNRHRETCSYLLNTAPDLALFADCSFGFVYSTLVLQHMEPRFSKRYIRELVRVLAPNGLLVFQLPSARIEPEPPAVVRSSTPISGQLPVNAFRALLMAAESSLAGHAGDRVAFDVVVENRSAHTWPALPDARGNYQINLANHWLDEHAELLKRDDARCPLPYDLEPGSRASLTLQVTAPRPDGVYWLELDLVQENVSWFSQRGADTLRIPCQVNGGILRRLPLREPRVSFAASEPASPFRRRHPRIFRLLRATGVRDAYWTYRRALDRIRSRRDQVLGRLKAPIINWCKRRLFRTQMEMHCVPRSEVLDLLAEGGVDLLYEEEEPTPHFLSHRYWVVRG